MHESTLALLFTGLLCATASAQEDYQARMGEPIQALTDAEKADFELGLLAFNSILTEAQGLGPIFNDSSCGQCHSKPAIGGFSTENVTRFGILTGGSFDPLDGTGASGLDLGGSLQQIQFLASHPEAAELVPPEANHTHERNTGHVFGAGLVQRLVDSQLLALEASPPSANVSGLASMVSPAEGGADRVGKFGWKSDTPTMLSFSSGAGKNELGLTNRFNPTENAPNGNAALLAGADSVPDPEDSAALANSILGTSGTREVIDWMDLFQQFLAPPPQTPKSGMTGEVLFDNIGCTDCHVRSWTTAPDSNPALDQVAIKPYSEFLLHDMGAGLADGIDQGGVMDGNSFRTTPLWGMAQKEGFLHDARSTGDTFGNNVHDAIIQHGGEGTAARSAYQALSLAQKGEVINFLGSLGRAEFDVDGSNHDQNNRVDNFDWFFMRNHPTDGDLFTGPGSFHTPDDVAAICDVDQDGDFDMHDFDVMTRAWTD